jgi:hypothetical protein
VPDELSQLLRGLLSSQIRDGGVDETNPFAGRMPGHLLQVGLVSKHEMCALFAPKTLNERE